MKKIILFAAAAMMAAVTFAQTPTVSASKVTMKYCKATYKNVPVLASSASLPVHYDINDGINDTSFTFSSFGNFVRQIQNVRGCDSVITFVVGPNTEGVLPGKFTVNALGKQIQFSKGNLQYKAHSSTESLKHMTLDGLKNGVFQLATTQYETTGDVDANKDKDDCMSTNIQDIFFFGASGYHNGSKEYVPCDFSSCGQSDIKGTKYDWGVYNAILGGGNACGVWRLITIEEWNYLMDTRNNAAQKKGWAVLQISDTKTINGFIILPDSWTNPQSCPTFNYGTATTNKTTYTLEQWNDMEENGAVFFPTTGYYQSGYKIDATEAYFHTTKPQFIGFDTWKINNSTSFMGGHVRLVCDVEE